MRPRPLAGLGPEFFISGRLPDLELVSETDEDCRVGNTCMIPKSLGEHCPPVGIDLDLLAFTEISGRDLVALCAVDGKAFQNSLNLLDQTAAASFERGPIEMRIAKDFLSTLLGEHGPPVLDRKSVV